MDIGSKSGGVASRLSSFPPRRFIFDAVLCESAEGLLQSFKFEKVHIQVEVCKLVGLQAKRRGSARNKAWKRVQRLWWNGIAFDRHGAEYQSLLDLAFDAMLQSESFRNALIASGDAVFTHSMGKSNPSDTVLTERELCSRLTALRAKVVA